MFWIGKVHSMTHTLTVNKGWFIINNVLRWGYTVLCLWRHPLLQSKSDESVWSEGSCFVSLSLSLGNISFQQSCVCSFQRTVFDSNLTTQWTIVFIEMRVQHVLTEDGCPWWLCWNWDGHVETQLQGLQVVREWEQDCPFPLTSSRVGPGYCRLLVPDCHHLFYIRYCYLDPDRLAEANNLKTNQINNQINSNTQQHTVTYTLHKQRNKFSTKMINTIHHCWMCQMAAITVDIAKTNPNMVMSKKNLLQR